MVYHPQTDLQLEQNTDTIAAVATPAGTGGIGVVRLSGSQTLAIAQTVTASTILPRRVLYRTFFGQNETVLDQGVLLYFAKPHSYTGEDLCEFQCHGSPVVLNLVIERLYQLGARAAEPGEFTKRAFLNNRMDLAQAEAVADLINSTTAAAARSALSSLQGEFSERIHKIQKQMLHLRMFIEAAIDFPEEEIDFLSDTQLLDSIERLRFDLTQVLRQSAQGNVLREGVSVVIAGLPNAGKSSLLNKLSGQDRVIVTPQAGTTRDTVDVTIDLNGLAVRLTDTAGLRESDDRAEKEGVHRTWKALEKADIVLYLVDCRLGLSVNDQTSLKLLRDQKIVLVWNKIDLNIAFELPSNQYVNVAVSALDGSNLCELQQLILELAGFNRSEEGVFMARRRHLEALKAANFFVEQASQSLVQQQAGELAAQDLADAMDALGRILGFVSADDLLGEIFANFCIGK